MQDGEESKSLKLTVPCTGKKLNVTNAANAASEGPKVIQANQTQ